jgi:hypothetical protein
VAFAAGTVLVSMTWGAVVLLAGGGGSGVGVASGAQFAPVSTGTHDKSFAKTRLSTLTLGSLPTSFTA